MPEIINRQEIADCQPYALATDGITPMLRARRRMEQQGQWADWQLLGRRFAIGCVALESYGADLAEVRSLAVDPAIRGRGLGARLLRFALATAKRRKIARVFAVTHAPDFFGRLGFVASTSAMAEALPEKIARDCRTCPKAEKCELVAVIATVIPERATLPILEAKPAPAV